MYEFIAITGRKNVRHFNALYFFSRGHMCVNGNTERERERVEKERLTYYCPQCQNNTLRSSQVRRERKRERDIVCVCVREREREKRERDLLPKPVSR